MEKIKSYKSKFIKSTSASLLIGTLMLTGVGATTIAHAEENTKTTSVATTNSITPLKIEDNKVYAVTVSKFTDKYPLDTSNFVSDTRLKDLDTNKLYFLGLAGEPLFGIDALNAFTDKKENIHIRDVRGNQVEGITALSIQVGSSGYVDVPASPKTLLFINFDSQERVVDNKVLDGEARANGRPYTVDVEKLYGKDIATNNKVKFDIKYDSKVTKQVNTKAVNIYMQDDDKSFSEADFVKDLNSDKAISAKVLQASNNSFLTFEALSEGTSTITITPTIDGKAVAEPKTFTLTLKEALKEKLTEPDDFDYEDDENNHIGDGENIDDEKPIVTPKPVPDDKDKDSGKTPNKDTNDNKNNGNNSSKNPVLTNPKDTNVSDKTKTNDVSITLTKAKDTDKKDGLKSLPKTGQEQSNAPIYAGILAIMLGIISTIGYTVFRKKHQEQ